MALGGRDARGPSEEVDDPVGVTTEGLDNTILKSSRLARL